VEEALAVVESREERFYEAEIHRIRGELLRTVVPPNEADAERSFHRAIEIARRQEAKSWELRSAMSMGRLWQRQGKGGDARESRGERERGGEWVGGVWGWFTEGFEWVDQREAKALLEAWSSPADCGISAGGEK